CRTLLCRDSGLSGVHIATRRTVLPPTTAPPDPNSFVVPPGPCHQAGPFLFVRNDGVRVVSPLVPRILCVCLGAMTAASRLREWELIRETPTGVKRIFDCSSGRAIAPAACCISFNANHMPFPALARWSDPTT